MTCHYPEVQTCGTKPGKWFENVYPFVCLLVCLIMIMGVCVCVRERERERECVYTELISVNAFKTKQYSLTLRRQAPLNLLLWLKIYLALVVRPWVNKSVHFLVSSFM